MPSDIPLEKKLDDLYRLIDGIETAMLTTRRADGQLVSRPMQTQRRTGGTDLWFMTNAESEKFEELARDPHVSLSYLRERTGEWVSVSGRAILSRDRDLIDALYRPEWKTWLDTPGDAKRDGGPHDPRIALILVEADSVTYSKDNRRMPVALFQKVKGMITSDEPKPADVHSLDRAELKTRSSNRPEIR
jgi:general stress protein 26